MTLVEWSFHCLSLLTTRAAPPPARHTVAMGPFCTYSNQLCTRFAHAAPPGRPSPPPPCFSRIRPWPISRFAASRGPCSHCSMCFRGAFAIHTQVATTASILRVLVGCTHVHWLVLYVVTNSVLWMLPRATPCDLAPGVVDGRVLAASGTMWRPERAVRASYARVWWPRTKIGVSRI